MIKYIKSLTFILIAVASISLNVNSASAQTQTVSLGQRYSVNGKVVENPWGGVSRQLTGWEMLMVLYGGYTFNTGGPTPAQISESSCPFGSALVGFNLYNMGSNYSTSGSLYCRPITFSSTAPVFDFSIGHGGNKTVVAGTDIVNMINTTLTNGATKDVSLSVASITNASNANVMNQTNGIFVPTSNSFSSGSIRPTAASELTLNTQTTTPVGTYTVTVRGTSAGTTGAGAGVIMECVSTINDTYAGNGRNVVQLSCLGYYPSDTSIDLLKTQDESMLYAAAEANNTDSNQLSAKNAVASTTNAWLNKLCDMSDNGVRDASDSIRYIGISNLGTTQIYNPVQTSLVWGGKTYAACASTITSSPINYQIVSVPNSENTIQLISGGSGTSGLSKTTSFTVNVIANPYNLAVTNSADSCYPADLYQTATWNAYPGATSYNIYRKAGTTVLATMSTTSTMYIEKPTQTGKIYEYQVAAVVGGVEQARSSAVTLNSANLLSCPSPSPSGGGGSTLVASCSVSPTSITAGVNTTVTITGTASGATGIEYSFDSGRSFSTTNTKVFTTSVGGSYNMIVKSNGNPNTPAIPCGTVTVKSLKLWLGKKTNTTLSNGGYVTLKAKKGEPVYINSLGTSGLTACTRIGPAWGTSIISNPLAIQNLLVVTPNVGPYTLTMTCQDNGIPISDSVMLEIVSSSIEEQ